MIRKLILALALLNLSVTAALAQTFPKPPDVPDYVPIAATYATGTTLNTLGIDSGSPDDGVNDDGGTPPYAGLAEVNDSTVGIVAGGGSCVTNDTDCPEAKFRTPIVGSHILFDDPIRNYGQPGTAHCHNFFGAKSANAYSTFASLRKGRGSSNSIPTTAPGLGQNNTAYWVPCVILRNPFGDGKDYVVKINHAIIYYTLNPGHTDFKKLTPIQPGERYVFAFPMDDPDNSEVLAEIAAANVAAGFERYSAPYKGFEGWKCNLANGDNVESSPGVTIYSQSFINEDGTDPWGGQCVPGSSMVAVFNAPECVDGTNPNSPGGYKHRRYLVYDSVSQRGECPLTWYRQPQLTGSIWWTTSGGFADYGGDLNGDGIGGDTRPGGQKAGWHLSSDPFFPGVQPGTTFHGDWLGGWRKTTLETWLDFCMGARWRTHGTTPHQCDNSTISATHRLNSVVADNLPRHGTASRSAMWELPATGGGQGAVPIRARPAGSAIPGN